MNVAIIIARGGSKRVPRKNVRDFVGRPMISWPIRAAMESGLFDRVVVSTEDREIAEIAARHGAEIPFLRPAALADDVSTMCDVLHHALGELSAAGQMAERCCCLYGTSYAAVPGILKNGLTILERDEVELVLAAQRYQHPIERSLIIDENGWAHYRSPEHVSSRTQDLPVSYHDVGLFYWFKTQAFAAHGSRSFLPLRKRVIEMQPLELVDIDDEADFALAERLFRSTAVI